jgi:hypothetical protein
MNKLKVNNALCWLLFIYVIKVCVCGNWSYVKRGSCLWVLRNVLKTIFGPKTSKIMSDIM